MLRCLADLPQGFVSLAVDGVGITDAVARDWMRSTAPFCINTADCIA